MEQASDVELHLNEEEMIAFIKDLLCLDNDSRWVYFSPIRRLEIKFRGNRYNVQRAIFDWLNVPERKRTYQKGGKRND